MQERLKFSEIERVEVQDRRRIRISLKSGRKILSEYMFCDDKTATVEDCGFFSHKAVDEYYNPTLNQLVKTEHHEHNDHW